MSREDIAEYIYNDILELCYHDLVDFEDCENIADYILANYTSKADHEAEIQGLELEIKLLQADKVWMKRKLKENVRLARVEVIEYIGDNEGWEETTAYYKNKLSLGANEK